MMNETAIGWTDLTWNLFSGCKKISAGCAHCYAEQLAEQRRGLPAFPHGFDLTLRPKNLLDPPQALKKHGPSIIFCESMSDVGLDDDELTPQELDRLSDAGFVSMNHVRDALFTSMGTAIEHRYQLVTKRPRTLLRYFIERGFRVPSCCWIGVTIEHRRELHRLETLREFRALGARVLFVSAEPLLDDLVAGGLRLDGVDWLIAGGESGTHASDPKLLRQRFLVSRAIHSWRNEDGTTGERGIGPWYPRNDRRDALSELRSLRDEVARAGCAFFFKQFGGPRPDSAGRFLDGRTHDELPEHVPGAMPPGRRERGAATAALARKLPMVQP